MGSRAARGRGEEPVMPRPCRRRLVAGVPQVTYYKPQGVPLRMLEQVVLGIDELEALRLADLEGLSQEEGGQRMNVSRPTFGRIVETARRKVAQALVGGLALRIEGGNVAFAPPTGEPAAEQDGPWCGHGRGGHGFGRGCGRRRGRGRGESSVDGI